MCQKTTHFADFGRKNFVVRLFKVLLIDFCESLFEVGYDVFGIFDADRETNKVGTNASFEQLLVGELAVSRARRIEDAGPSVGDVNDYRGELQRIHEPYGSFPSSLYREGNDPAGAPGIYFSASA